MILNPLQNININFPYFNTRDTIVFLNDNLYMNISLIRCRGTNSY